MDATFTARSAAALQYRRGALLVAGAALAWSSAGLIQRWADTPPWTTLFWRSVFACLFLLGQMLVQSEGVGTGFRRLRLGGWIVAACFAGSMICFINALALTRVANVLVFQAAAPFIAALMARFWIKERLPWRKAIPIAVTLLGVLVMVSGSTGPNSHVGNVLSAVMAVCFAGTIVLTRAHPGLPVTAASCAAMLLTAAAALPFTELALPWRDYLLLALFGVGQMGLGSVMFAAGVKLLPAADAGVITVLETVLGPLWVWIAFAETPSGAALLGGGMVIAAVIATALMERSRTVPIRTTVPAVPDSPSTLPPS